MGTKKMGRPTEEPKRNQMRIRLSDEETEKLNYCSQETGKSKSDVIRLGIDKVYQEVKK